MNTQNNGFIGEIPENPFLQQYSDTCAIKSQQLILNEFGIQVTEDELVQYSIEHGWYSGDGSGTLMSDVGNLIADAGIPCTQHVDANVFDLTNELAQGHKIIVGVDSSELHNNSLKSWINDLFHGDTPDHALIVAGIDMTDPDNPTVILTDPGTGEAVAPYPMDQFMDAWADSSHFMLSTDIPVPEAVETFENFDLPYHLPEIAGVDFDTFDMFHNYSHCLPDQALYPEITNPMDSLYNAFTAIPTMPGMDFSGALSYVGLPPMDLSMMPAFSPFDPMMYDYGMYNNSFADLATLHSASMLHQSYYDCLDYAQDAMDSGNPVTAQLFNNLANNADNAFDNLLNNLI